MLRAQHRIALTLGAAALVGLAFACSSTPAAKSDKLCTPGAYVFCRCKDRSEGAKLCNEDAVSFGPCEPCESLGLGEDLDPGPPPEDFDGGGLPERCGDGVAQLGEDCDDKNAVENDGCTKDCKLTPITPATASNDKSRTCPGLEVHVWGDTHKPQTTGTTMGSGNHSTTPNCTTYGAMGAASSGASGNDRVFKVVAHKTGQMTVKTTDVNYNSFLYVSASCPLPDGGSDVPFLACINDVNGNGGETLSFPVDDGKTYYVFVDGAGITTPNGNFRVTFEIP